jgi:hypothetical protein
MSDRVSEEDVCIVQKKEPLDIRLGLFTHSILRVQLLPLPLQILL